MYVQVYVRTYGGGETLVYLKQTRRFLFGCGRRCAFTVISFPDCLIRTNTRHGCSEPLQDSLGNADNSSVSVYRSWCQTLNMHDFM